MGVTSRGKHGRALSTVGAAIVAPGIILVVQLVFFGMPLGLWLRGVDGGLRYLPGAWGTEDRLFDASNSVALYTERPPGEEPGEYPSPAG